MEVLQAAMNLEKDLLDDVFHVPAATEQALNEPGDVGAVLPEQLAEGLEIARLVALNDDLRLRHGAYITPVNG
jgi:hypothetical protein